MSTTINETDTFWRETERLLDGLDNARGEREDPFWRETEKFLQRVDDEALERAADRVDELSAGWIDELTGYPLPGFQSVRYRTPDELAYKAWLRGPSRAAERTRSVQGL